MSGLFIRSLSVFVLLNLASCAWLKQNPQDVQEIEQVGESAAEEAVQLGVEALIE